MNRQTLIVLGGGLCVALLVALLMQAMVGSPNSAEGETVQTTSILVAAKNLNIGDTLDATSMQWKKWPENAVFQGAIVKEGLELQEDELALNGRLVRNIAAGEPLMQTAVIAEEKGNFVAAKLNKGMRAMAIKVKAESSVGGFIAPDDRVDVILTYEVRVPSDERVQDASLSIVSRRAAQTVLENIRIVGVDQESKEVETAKIANTVTVEVTPKQAEILALAEAMGNLSLVLRQLGDESTIVGEGEKIPESTTDTRMSNVMQELLGNKNSSGVQSTIVRVYNGATPTDLVVRPSSAQ